MIAPELIYASAPQPRLVLSGDHSDLAERFRQRAMSKSITLIICAELLNLCLREHPDEDERFDQAAEMILPLIKELGLEVQAFRETRHATSEN